MGCIFSRNEEELKEDFWFVIYELRFAVPAMDGQKPHVKARQKHSGQAWC